MFVSPEVDQALQQITDQIGQQYPEMGEVLTGLRDGSVTQEEAVVKFMAFVQEHPDAAASIEGVAKVAFAPTRDEAPSEAPGVELPVPVVNEALPFQPHDLLFQAPGAKLPRLDPLVEAAIAERAQFDGDVPELRSGRLPEGATPAVPVETMARNPAAIGKMLQEAATEVGDEMRQLEFDHEQKLLAAGAVIGENGEVLLPVPTEDGAALLRPQAPDPEGYQRGQVPAARPVETPSGSALARMTQDEKSQAAWTTLSTTQGRKSALAVIRELVAVGLASAGYEVVVNDTPAPKQKEDVPIHVEWSVGIAGSGPNAHQGSFSFIDVAAKALLYKMVAKLDSGVTLQAPVLEVMPINAVDVRRVGWQARLVEA